MWSGMQTRLHMCTRARHSVKSHTPRRELRVRSIRVTSKYCRTGTAFNNQPVFGDNTLYRPVHQGRFHDSEGVVYTEREVYDTVEIAQGIFSPYNQVHAY